MRPPAPPLDQRLAEEDTEMSFLDHLEALRWHILRSLIAVVVFAVLAFINIGFVFDTIFLGPFHLDFWTYRQLCAFSDALCVKEMGFRLINTAMAGQFMTHISMSFSIGFVLAFPYALWEIWRFFRPALNAAERATTRGIVFFSTMLFAVGLLFGYFVITPVTVQFLGNYRLSEEIANTIQLTDYISTVTMTTFSIALIFELPMVVYFLSMGGIFTPGGMRRYRRHAVLAILILSAVLTPSSDILSMVLVSVPFLILYELSIAVSLNVEKRRRRKEAQFYEDNTG